MTSPPPVCLYSQNESAPSHNVTFHEVTLSTALCLGIPKNIWSILFAMLANVAGQNKVHTTISQSVVRLDFYTPLTD